VSIGEALVAAAGVEHGLFNDGANPLLVLVILTPPPPHGAASHEKGGARS